MLEVGAAWVETHSRLLAGLAALLTVATFAYRWIGWRVVEKFHWWRFVAGYMFMGRIGRKIMLAWLECVALLPFDKHDRAVRLTEQYYQTPRKDRKVFLDNLCEADRVIVQRISDKADAVLFVEALNEVFGENGHIKDQYLRKRKRLSG